MLVVLQNKAEYGNHTEAQGCETAALCCDIRGYSQLIQQLPRHKYIWSINGYISNRDGKAVPSNKLFTIVHKIY